MVGFGRYRGRVRAEGVETGSGRAQIVEGFYANLSVCCRCVLTSALRFEKTAQPATKAAKLELMIAKALVIDLFRG